MKLRCPVCNYSFYSKALDIRNSIATIENVKISCPQCRSMVPYPDGKFAFDSAGEATLISELRAMKLSKAQVDRLKIVAESARSGELTEEEFKQEVQKISAKLTRLFPYVNPSGFLVFLATLLLILSTAKIGYKQRVEKTMAELTKKSSTNIELVEKRKKRNADRDSNFTDLRRQHRQWAEKQQKSKRSK